MIGEASARISQDLKTRYPDVEWRRMAAFRNIAVHAYFAVDWHIVWFAATDNAPEVSGQVAKMLEDEFGAADAEPVGEPDLH